MYAVLAEESLRDPTHLVHWSDWLYLGMPPQRAQEASGIPMSSAIDEHVQNPNHNTDWANAPPLPPSKLCFGSFAHQIPEESCEQLESKDCYHQLTIPLFIPYLFLVPAIPTIVPIISLFPYVIIILGSIVCS